MFGKNEESRAAVGKRPAFDNSYPLSGLIPAAELPATRKIQLGPERKTAE